MRKHEPTPETRAVVRSLSQYGIPRDHIAAHITELVAPEPGCSEPTLRKHYAAELSAGKLAANVNVLKFLYSGASGMILQKPKEGEVALPGHDTATFRDCLSAAMFWAKTQAGFKESVDVNHQHSFVDGARERLAGKLGVAIPAEREEGEVSIPHPIGSA